MYYWLDLHPKQYYELYNLNLFSFIPTFLNITQYWCKPLCLGFFLPWCLKTVRITFLAFFLHGTFVDEFLSELVSSDLDSASILIWSADRFFIFRLHGRQEVAPFFAGQEATALIFIFHLILHGYWKSVLSWNDNIILRGLFITDGLIWLIVLTPLYRRWR